MSSVSHHRQYVPVSRQPSVLSVDGHPRYCVVQYTPAPCQPVVISGQIEDADAEADAEALTDGPLSDAEADALAEADAEGPLSDAEADNEGPVSEALADADAEAEADSAGADSEADAEALAEAESL